MDFGPLSADRTFGILLATCVFAVGCSSQTESTPIEKLAAGPAQCAEDAVPKQFVVNWKDGRVSVVKGLDRDEFVREVLEPHDLEIEFAEPDHVIRLPAALQIEPASKATLWAATDVWGQEKVGAPASWSEGIDGNGIVVAVIDSGVDITHAQIRNQLHLNDAEIVNGIDDDGNGLKDDLAGYDFEKRTGTVTDGTGHGTHVSGIILADHETGSVQGVAPKARLLPLDFMNNKGQGLISDAVDAILYAVSRGARVINASWGGAPCSRTLQNTIASLESKGILFVSASGNDGLNIDQDPEFPAAFGLPGQITVGASTARDNQAQFSNYGTRLVHLLAPGVNIISTVPGGTEALSGTSMAAPFVSGAAALLMSYRPRATIAQIKTALLNSVDSGSYAVSTRGRLNVTKAIEELGRLVAPTP